MPVEIGLWRVDEGAPRRIPTKGVPLEAQLETYIESDPALLGGPLLLIGRQVPTGFGYIDLLGIDVDGGLHILELKRERTPRDVVAQVLDYGAWAAELSHEDVLDVYSSYRSDVAFEQAFAEHLGVDPPEEVNTVQTLTIIASDVDPATERITRYLNDGFGVPVNVVFFRYFADNGRSYIARTWLLAEEGAGKPEVGTGKRGKGKQAWNGRDWYVSFGEYEGGRNWDDAQRYGFVSAGGGLWYSRSLRGLPLGARVSVCIPKRGYVGVGTVAGEAQRFDDAVVIVDGHERKLSELDLHGNYQYSPGGDTDETAEYVVPVKWEKVRAREDAVWKAGMFANQNSACKLRNQFTLDVLAGEFELQETAD